MYAYRQKITTLMRYYPADSHTQVLNAQNLWGKTPLHYAVIRNKSMAARVLIQHGASPTISDKNGTTPLQAAEKSSDVSLRNIFRLVYIYRKHRRKTN